MDPYNRYIAHKVYRRMEIRIDEPDPTPQFDPNPPDTTSMDYKTKEVLLGVEILSVDGDYLIIEQFGNRKRVPKSQIVFDRERYRNLPFFPAWQTGRYNSLDDVRERIRDE